jgi:hypothetical protein
LIARELAGESLTKLMNDINRRIFELIHSSDNNDKMAGILAIGTHLFVCALFVPYQHAGCL